MAQTVDEAQSGRVLENSKGQRGVDKGRVSWPYLWPAAMRKELEKKRRFIFL